MSHLLGLSGLARLTFSKVRDYGFLYLVGSCSGQAFGFQLLPGSGTEIEMN